MTDRPPPLPTADGSPAGSSRPREPWWFGAAAVLVIVVSVVVAMAGVVAEKAAAKKSGETESGTARIESETGGRYLVGMHAVLGSALEATGQPKATLLAPMEQAATSPRQWLEVEILRRELLGPESTPRVAEAPDGASEEDRKDWAAWRLMRSENGEAVEPRYTADRDRFTQRLGWFGRLAASHGAGEGDPQRRAVMSQAKRTFIGCLVLIAGAVGAGVAGCALAVWMLARFATGRSQWRFAATEGRVVAASGGTIWLETFAVYIGLMVLGGVAADALPRSWMPWPQAAAILGAAGVGLWWPVYRGLSRTEYRAGFGLSTGRGVWREMAAGVAGYCAGLPIIALGTVLTVKLTLVTQSDASHPLNHLTGVSPPLLILLGLLAAVWAPVVEELFFRGAFYAAWRQRFGRWVSVVATGLIFAAVHPQGWTAIPALGAVGLVFALLREWRGSNLAPMTAHALNNGTLFALMVVVLR